MLCTRANAGGHEIHQYNHYCFYCFEQMSDGASSKDKKRSKSPPPGFQKVRGEYWEACKKPLNRKPVNNHTGVYAFHADDCMCGMAGWPCFRQGHIWSCCGSTEKYSKCAGQTTKGKG